MPIKKEQEDVESPEETKGDSYDESLVSEEFQKQVQDMLKGCNEACLQYIRHCMNKKENDLMKKEDELRFSDEKMPS